MRWLSILLCSGCPAPVATSPSTATPTPTPTPTPVTDTAPPEHRPLGGRVWRDERTVEHQRLTRVRVVHTGEGVYLAASSFFSDALYFLDPLRSGMVDEDAVSWQLDGGNIVDLSSNLNVADFDGDGLSEIHFAQRGQWVWVEGMDTLPLIPVLTDVPAALGYLVGAGNDLDGDGIVDDSLSPDGRTDLYFGPLLPMPTVAFSMPRGWGPVGRVATGFVVLDLDQPELLLLPEQPLLDPEQALHRWTLPGLSPASVLLDDLDQNGTRDLVAGVVDGGGLRYAAFVDVANGSQEPHWTLSADEGGIGGRRGFGDVNGDGVVDFLCSWTSASGEPSVLVFLGPLQGDDVASEADYVLTTEEPLVDLRGLHLVDVDADGREEVVLVDVRRTEGTSKVIIADWPAIEATRMP